MSTTERDNKMKTLKQEFIEEINTIQNNDWKNQALKAINNLPEYFWTAPACSSGKYHPVCDLGEGGLIRHSIMVEKIAMNLLEAEIFVPYDPITADILKIAALFHDCIKQGDGSTNATVFNHPILSADFVRDNIDLGLLIYNKTLYNMVARHMGKWTTSKYAPGVTLEKPETDLEKLLHTADMISSQKYIGGMAQWGYINDPRPE